MLMMIKGLFIAIIALQLLLALTQTGWVRSAAELSAFLLVVMLSFTIKPTKEANSKTTPI